MEEYHDLQYGKFESPMAKFMYERVLLEGDHADDEYGDGYGNWGVRYGRRVIEGDDQGFVYYCRCDDEAEATALFRYVATMNEPEEDE